MYHFKILFFFTFLHLIITELQLNLYYTNLTNKNENESLQHNCLHLIAGINEKFNDHEKLIYCMSELSSEFHIKIDDRLPKYTFAELAKQNITSQQLYLWSTPIDIIENYQDYLNQSSITNYSILGKYIFYNCTLPRFGPQCQYEILYYHPSHTSFFDILTDFNRYYYEYLSTNLTCYMHLECNRGPLPLCLDWTEICDGQINCLNDGIDEKYCWPLEINQCEENEYRCKNGQCIPKYYHQDDSNIPDCIDKSDFPVLPPTASVRSCHIKYKPTFGCDDQACPNLSPFTSSCVKKRNDLLMQAMYLSKSNSLSNNCWLAFKCLLKFQDSDYSSCDALCKQNRCINIVQEDCPDLLYFPNVPVLFGNLYFVYKKNEIQSWIQLNTRFYICYDTSDYDDFFTNISKIILNSMTCVSTEYFYDLKAQHFSVQYSHRYIITQLYHYLKMYHLVFDYNSSICNKTNMYQCIHSSKCILIHRIMDNKNDCPYKDDEDMVLINNNYDLLNQIKKTHYKCLTINKYISPYLLQNDKCDCGFGTHDCDDEKPQVQYVKTTILFQYICDRHPDLLPIPIDGKNETDETECQQWECDNIYTHCNDQWNCPNLVDETVCKTNFTFNCSLNGYPCISPDTKQLICLSGEKINDDNIDCFGATDEPKLCETNYTIANNMVIYYFYCKNSTYHLCLDGYYLCDGYANCPDEDDEQICTNQTITEDFCRKDNKDLYYSNAQQFLCFRSKLHPEETIPYNYFKLDEMTNLIDNSKKKIDNIMSSNLFQMTISNEHQPRCHYGLDLRIWLDKSKNLTRYTCLCPPSYYGNQCQYQTQRVSVGIHFEAFSDSWQTLFAIVISLIDDSNQRIIHSYQHINYLSTRDCKTKFNINLLYSTQPKDPTKDYAIHIDIYEKETFEYRGSILLPISFSFLPVHRLASIVNIPQSKSNTKNCPKDQCNHGVCITYSNNPQKTFCQCDKGWSGLYCTIQHTCTCSSDSLCLGVSANNQSICICPKNKFGSRCLLASTICDTNTSLLCQNNGKCIFDEDYLTLKQAYTCICPRSYRGNQCEIPVKKLNISFDQNIILQEGHIFVHFIDVHSILPFDGTQIESSVRLTTFQTILFKQHSVTIYWSQPFHLVFIEVPKTGYYLTVVQNTYNESSTISKTIKSVDRCLHINELFNQTFLQWHLIRRIKYYHLPCQNYSLNLSCFYDEIHFCLCYQFSRKRLANCFRFNHSMTYNCQGRSECEHDGQCVQDHPTCPKRSICLCRSCDYGRLCQFRTSGFGLSLDAILGYHILPNKKFNIQPFIVKLSLGLTIIFIFIGLINGILSLITFKNKIICEVGCGLYLLCSSIIILLIMIMFGLKFFILLFAQMTIISNRSFLLIQCYSFDFLLRIFLHMEQWLNACVATERATTTIIGAQFNKRKSKKAAKLVIPILLIVIIGSSIHDPISRRLIDEINNDDDDEYIVKRTWCIVSYNYRLNIYNYVINILHFFGPFLINIISSIILITTKTRQQLNICTKRSYKEILRKQFQQYKYLLTAPILLFLLAIPRVILTFLSNCMNSTNDSWIFLAGYFISFIPPELTFVVYIIPSKFYKKQFYLSLRNIRNNIRRCLHFNE